MHRHSESDRLWQFQLWLLSTMDVFPDRLNQSLRELGASEAEMAAMREKMIGLGVGETFETIGLYRQILGNPLKVEELSDSTISPPFRESVVLHFRLPLWPDLDFVINETRDGVLWGHRFERSHGSFCPKLIGLTDLKPWKFLRSEIIRHFGEPESEDGWNNMRTLFYLLPSPHSGVLQRYFLLFDYDLFEYYKKVD